MVQSIWFGLILPRASQNENSGSFIEHQWTAGVHLPFFTTFFFYLVTEGLCGTSVPLCSIRGDEKQALWRKLFLCEAVSEGNPSAANRSQAPQREQRECCSWQPQSSPGPSTKDRLCTKTRHPPVGFQNDRWSG